MVKKKQLFKEWGLVEQSTRQIALEGNLFISHEYISSATGELCKTYSCTYSRDGKIEVMCLDMKCPV